MTKNNKIEEISFEETVRRLLKAPPPKKTKKAE